jgi:hypothetical protein
VQNLNVPQTDPGHFERAAPGLVFRSLAQRFRL